MLRYHYFNGKLKQGFVALFSGRMIQLVGTGLTGLFIPVFLLEKMGYSITLVLLYFIVIHFCYAFLVPFAAIALNKIGMRRSLRISIIFDALFYFFLFFIQYYPVTMLVLAGISTIMSRTLFWLPFHVDFAKFTDLKNRGKEVSLFWATRALISIIMPLLSGFLIGLYGFNAVFALTIILILTSWIPFLGLPGNREIFEWTYVETFKNFFKKENRSLVIANMANGAENDIAIVVWPIFIWQLLKGNYFAVGALSSLIVLSTILLQFAVGKFTDIVNKRKLLRWGSMLYAAGWFAKVFVITAFQTYVVGAYHSFTQIFKDTPFDALNYEIMADQGHFIDEYTVIKEMAVQFGKVLVLCAAVVVSLTLGMQWTFALAALASLLINFL